MGLDDKKAILRGLARPPAAEEDRGRVVPGQFADAKLDRIMGRIAHPAAYIPLLIGLVYAGWLIVQQYNLGAQLLYSGGPVFYISRTFFMLLLTILLLALEFLLLFMLREVIKGRARWWAAGSNGALILLVVGIGPGMAGAFHLGRVAAWRRIDTTQLGAVCATMPALKRPGETRTKIIPSDTEYERLPTYIHDTLRPTQVVLNDKVVIVQIVEGGGWRGSEGLIIPLVPLTKPLRAYAEDHSLQILSTAPIILRYSEQDADQLQLEGLIDAGPSPYLSPVPISPTTDPT